MTKSLKKVGADSKRMLLLYLISAYALFFFQPVLPNAQNEAHDYIKEMIASRKVPGMAFLVAKNGEVIEEGYYGKANLELNADVDEKSVFAIASMSKTYTAAAILIMAERGLISLDDHIHQYIPEAPDTWKKITIKHLLTHSSGLVDDWALYDWDKSNALFIQSLTDSMFLQHLFSQELRFEPGTNHAYSCGPFVLGVVIERITGEYYEQFIKENIFEPLGLNETFVDDPYRIIPHRVSGYFNYDPKVINSRISGLGNGILLSPTAYGRADVGIRTTARELMQFYDALLKSKIISEESTELMFGPAKLDNGAFISTGAGWMNWPLGGASISEHSGGFRTGFSSQAFLVPKDNFIVIILSNLSGGVSFSLAQQIASIYYPEFQPISKKSIQASSDTTMTNAHLRFFQSMNSEQKNSNASTAFPYTYYSNSVKALVSKISSIEYLGEKNVQTQEMKFFGVQIYKLIYYTLNGDRTLYTTIYLDRDDKIVFIDYPESE